ncbi:MAG: FAD-dependent oxidoreductase, partial [Caulobacterales bacterium]
ELPLDTTSCVAGAQWWPSYVYDSSNVSAAFSRQFLDASRYAFRHFQAYVGSEYGVNWEANYVVSGGPVGDHPASPGDPLRQFVVNQQDLGPRDHPFSAAYVRRFDTMMIDSPTYLRRLEADFRMAGGEIVVRDFGSVAQIQQLPERVIFNCTGLGAGRLFGDGAVEPVRGQLVILLPQPEIDYNVLTTGDNYMFGRRDGVVLGGTFQRGNSSLEPDNGDTLSILRAHQEFFSRMRED